PLRAARPHLALGLSPLPLLFALAGPRLLLLAPLLVSRLADGRLLLLPLARLRLPLLLPLAHARLLPLRGRPALLSVPPGAAQRRQPLALGADRPALGHEDPEAGSAVRVVGILGRLDHE